MNHWRKWTRTSVRNVSLPALALCIIAATGTLSESVSGPADPATSPIAQKVLSSPESATIGETTFYQNCVYCHGSKGSGGKARKLQCRDLTPDYLFTTISNGKKRGSLIMPPWKNAMDEETRWQLVAYIESLAKLPTCTK